MSIFNWIYWIIALVASGLLGWKAIEIFTDVAKRPKDKQPPAAWWYQQRWFNFLGSLVGWFALWILLRRYWTCVAGDCVVVPNLWDVLAAFIAFIGVTGYLPFTVFGLISSVYLVGIKAADLLQGLPKQK